MTLRPSSTLLLAFSLALAACETSAGSPGNAGSAPIAGKPASQASQADPVAQPLAAAPKKAYGDPLSSAAERVALVDLLHNPDKYADRAVRTEGKVTAVCQNRGCWLELGDDTGVAHVKLGSHKFFVPRTASGQHAEVEARVMPAVDKGHCEEEAQEQTGKLAKVELNATGVELSAAR